MTIAGDILVRCVRQASLAPSLHNSQPWRFRISAGVVAVYADPGRRLDALDPAGRELLISVGAAVFTLRLALRAEGWIPGLTLFPEPGSPDLVARMVPEQAAEPSSAVREMAAAIAQRHTNRWPFAPEVVPADAIEQLTQAATHEGATFAVAGPVSRDAILGLGLAAEKRFRHHGAYRTELRRWTRPAPGRRDGIPPSAIGPWDALERLPVRDFGLMQTQPWRTSERFEAYPTIGVLATHADGPAEWVGAGQALQRVLLKATQLHLATTPISQPVEIPAVRELLSDIAADRWAQMVIRLGFGPPAASTPRRPLAEILDVGIPQAAEGHSP